jgi:hypothetical protein
MDTLTPTQLGDTVRHVTHGRATCATCGGPLPCELDGPLYPEEARR